MIIRTVLAAVAVIAVPIAVQGAEAPRQTPPKAEKRTCEVNTPLGSRLGGVRRCRSASEREAHKAEARLTVDRIQSFKPVICAPPNPC